MGANTTLFTTMLTALFAVPLWAGVVFEVEKQLEGLDPKQREMMDSMGDMLDLFTIMIIAAVLLLDYSDQR